MSQKTYKRAMDVRISTDVSGSVISSQTTAAWANSAAKDIVKSLTQIPTPNYPVSHS